MIKRVIAIISRGEAKNYLTAKRNAEDELKAEMLGSNALFNFNQLNFAPVKYEDKEG